MSTEKTNTSRRATARPRPAARPRAERATKRDAQPKRVSRTAGAAARAPRPGAASVTKAAASKIASADPKALLARFRVPLIAAAVVLVAVAMLYGPACTYYQAWRANGVLQERDSQAEADTEQLKSDIDGLMTEEGIKDEARRRGYVEEGETRIVVEGQDADDDQQAEQDAETVPWYIALGDFVFQYQGV